MRVRMMLVGATLMTGLAACGGTAGTAHKGAAPGAPAEPAAVEVRAGQSSLGQILIDQDGRTLYAFVNDKGGNAACTADCVAGWPALTGTPDATAGRGLDAARLVTGGDADGGQISYNGWKLYYYVGDEEPGDVDGQGVDGNWFALGPDGTLIKTPQMS
jgi:predicted lipoprotein with Yx(FWY)xxD motif